MILETERLILRSTTESDAAFVAALYTDPEVCRFLGGVKAPEETIRKVQEVIAHEQLHGFARWSVALKNTGDLIGRCGPMLTEVEGVSEIELGYSLIRSCWGHGYATEAARAALDYCIHVLGHRRVIALIEPGNSASFKVAEKIGMRREGMVDWKNVRVHLLATGRP